MIKFLASILFVIRFFKKNKKVSQYLITTLVLFSIFYFFNSDMAITMISLILRLGFSALLLISQFAFLFMFMARSKTITIIPGDKNQLTLNDYKGQDILVENMRQWIKTLRGDKKFQEMGGEPPRGLLLVGRAGTGKTQLLKCLSGEAGIAMHAIEGSGFKAMFWGIDILKMNQFVNKARNLALEYGSAICYIDEIDAVASSRGGVMGGQNQPAGMMGIGGGSLSTLLTQMDGLSEEREFIKCQNIIRKLFGMKSINEGYVMFVGATNRPDVLDPAIVRAGRLDKTITVEPPDAKGRKEIFEYYLNKIKHDDINVDSVVAFSHGITPAEIAMSVQRDSVRNARFANRNSVTQEDLEWALVEERAGFSNPIDNMPIEQQKQVCIHESGHAVALYHLRKDRLISFVSTVRRGSALGMVIPVDTETNYAIPLKSFIADIRISMAGDKATEVLLGERWTGARGDIEHIKNYVSYLVHHGVFGQIPFGNSESIMNNEQVQKWIISQWEATQEFCENHIDEIRVLSDVLMEKKELPGREAIKIIESVIGERKNES